MIINTPIVEEVEQSFLDYSLSVITDRAIPSVEDGFKPVVRRILYDMYDSGYTNNKKYVKCAKPVGETMARLHPHGDSSIYGALVNIAQPWTMRYPLIDFHGNCGSRDGDGPAAYRYTECKLAPIAEETLVNIKKDTVNWFPTYTEEEQEPEYLPGKFPNLLCNGTSGIAVALACQFLPNNLTEVMNCAITFVKDNNIDISNYIIAPDFPTGGIIINKNDMRTNYLSGKGKVKLRGEYHIETEKGKDIIVFDSIPYKVSKETLTQEIDQLCEEKKIEGISEIRDESNKEGIRFVIELNKGISGDMIAKQLYHFTDLESTYNFNQVALVNKHPKLLNFKELIAEYVKHQQDVFRRATKYDFDKLSARLHILDGLLIASENIDEIIKLIKSASNTADAAQKLQNKYNFSEAQTKAILDMKLSRLTQIEKVSIEEEIKDKTTQRDILNDILTIPAKFDAALIKEFENFKNKYGDERRTKVIQINESDKDDSDIVEITPENCIVMITQSGNIKRIPISSFRTQKRNGKGVKNQDDIISDTITSSTIDSLIVFSSAGRAYKLNVIDIPVGTNVSRGVDIHTLVDMDANEKYAAAVSVSREKDKKPPFIWFITKNGLIKKTALNEYTGIKRKGGIAATTIKEGDKLLKVILGDNDFDLGMFTKNGIGIRFNTGAIGATARTASGVKGITLKEDDEIVSATIIDKPYLVFITEDGMAKRIESKNVPVQNRAGKGLIYNKDKEIVNVSAVEENNNLLLCSNKTNICVAVSSAPIVATKTSVGAKMIKDGKVISVSIY